MCGWRWFGHAANGGCCAFCQYGGAQRGVWGCGAAACVLPPATNRGQLCAAQVRRGAAWCRKAALFAFDACRKWGEYVPCASTAGCCGVWQHSLHFSACRLHANHHASGIELACPVANTAQGVRPPCLHTSPALGAQAIGTIAGSNPVRRSPCPCARPKAYFGISKRPRYHAVPVARAGYKAAPPPPHNTPIVP